MFWLSVHTWPHVTGICLAWSTTGKLPFGEQRSLFPADPDAAQLFGGGFVAAIPRQLLELGPVLIQCKSRKKTQQQYRSAQDCSQLESRATGYRRKINETGWECSPAQADLCA